jgi:AraC-like DNA-binding protein
MQNIPLLRLPQGIPTCSSRHGIFVWPRGLAPTSLLSDDYDLFWVTRGSATLELTGGTVLRASTDQLMILPPLVSGIINEAEAPLSFHYFHFDFRSALRKQWATPPPPRKVTVPMMFSRQQAPGVARALRAVSRLDRSRPGADWQLEQLTIDMITELARFGERRGRKAGDRLFHSPELGDPRVAALCQRIQQDPARSWSVTDLAESVGLSPSRLHALCRQMLGRSLKSHIVRTRLQRALLLLREQENERPSVKEVSIACGFSSQHFFSRQFKAMFKVTPIEFRDGSAL